jgi:hypothetical protein
MNKPFIDGVPLKCQCCHLDKAKSFLIFKYPLVDKFEDKHNEDYKESLKQALYQRMRN